MNLDSYMKSLSKEDVAGRRGVVSVHAKFEIENRILFESKYEYVGEPTKGELWMEREPWDDNWITLLRSMYIISDADDRKVNIVNRELAEVNRLHRLNLDERFFSFMQDRIDESPDQGTYTDNCEAGPIEVRWYSRRMRRRREEDLPLRGYVSVVAEESEGEIEAFDLDYRFVDGELVFRSGYNLSYLVAKVPGFDVEGLIKEMFRSPQEGTWFERRTGRLVEWHAEKEGRPT